MRAGRLRGPKGGVEDLDISSCAMCTVSNETLHGVSAHARVAQGIEQSATNRRVGGSNPSPGTITTQV